MGRFSCHKTYCNRKIQKYSSIQKNINIIFLHNTIGKIFCDYITRKLYNMQTIYIYTHNSLDTLTSNNLCVPQNTPTINHPYFSTAK